LESTFIEESGYSPAVFKGLLKFDKRYNRELGSEVHAPKPYSNHAFVFVAPEGRTTIDSPAPISLVLWTKLCNALGDDGTAKLDETQAQHFRLYTGLEYTRDNVDAAIKSGVLLLRSKMPSVSDASDAGETNNSSDDIETESTSTRTGTGHHDSGNSSQSQSSDDHAAGNPIGPPGGSMSEAYADNVRPSVCGARPTVETSESIIGEQNLSETPTATITPDSGNGASDQFVDRPRIYCCGVDHPRINQYRGDIKYLMSLYEWSGQPPAWRVHNCAKSKVRVLLYVALVLRNPCPCLS